MFPSPEIRVLEARKILTAEANRFIGVIFLRWLTVQTRTGRASLGKKHQGTEWPGAFGIWRM